MGYIGKAGEQIDYASQPASSPEPKVETKAEATVSSAPVKTKIEQKDSVERILSYASCS